MPGVLAGAGEALPEWVGEHPWAALAGLSRGSFRSRPAGCRNQFKIHQEFFTSALRQSAEHFPLQVDGYYPASLILFPTQRK